MAITIKPVTTLAECRHIVDITLSAWDTDEADAIPDHTSLIVAKERGGAVLLAWDGDKPVGFCWGFLAFAKDGKTLKHASHQAAVIPEYQGKGVGELLKWAQRDVVLAMDVKHMTWTFDPLWTLNGRLNLHKLGGVCHTFKRNLYGKVNDGLNRGLPTDRFLLDWWLDTKRVSAHANQTFVHLSLLEWQNQGAILLNPADKPLTPSQFEALALPETGNSLLMAVPKYYPSLVQSDMNAAMAWRMLTRHLFEWAFGQGYEAMDLICGEEMCYYVLRMT
jgi:predicted GNAT superfamily acetyltransferase